MTYVGLSVVVAAGVAISQGYPKKGLLGIVLGGAIIVFSEWNRWRNGE
jgi:hypothetical protein